MAKITGTDLDATPESGRLYGSNAGDTLGRGNGFNRIHVGGIAPDISGIHKLTALAARNGYIAARRSLKRHEGCVLISV